MKNRLLLMVLLLYSIDFYGVSSLPGIPDGDVGTSASIWDKPVQDRYFIYEGLKYRCLTDSTAEVAPQRYSDWTEFEDSIKNIKLYLSGEIVIPNRVYCEGHELLVTEIGAWAFFQQNITAVTIPDYVETIELEAFYRVKSLRKVTFSSQGNLRLIKEYAFEETGIEGVVEIPEGVEVLSPWAFMYTGAVHTWVLPSTIKTVSNGCLGSTGVSHVDVVCHFTICPVLDEDFGGFYPMFGSPYMTTIWAPDECVELFKTHYPFIFRPDKTGVPGDSNYRRYEYDYLDIRPLSDYTPYDPSSIRTAGRPEGECEAVGRYNLQGVNLQHAQRGLNIVTMSDGSKRKVLVK